MGMTGAPSKAAAQALGLKRYFTGKPCPAGHIADRYTSGGCVVCGAMNAAAWKKRNPERHAQLNRRCFYNNPSLQAAHNAESLRRAKMYPEKVRFFAAKRRAAKIRATPAWADLEAIKRIYAEAVAVNHDVDHIVPLRGETVCGLHVPENLQLLPPSANRRKSNKFSAGWE